MENRRRDSVKYRGKKDKRGIEWVDKLRESKQEKRKRNRKGGKDQRPGCVFLALSQKVGPDDRVWGPAGLLSGASLNLAKSNACPRLVFTHLCLTLGFTDHMCQRLHTKRLMRQNVSGVGAESQLGGDTERFVAGESMLYRLLLL